MPLELVAGCALDNEWLKILWYVHQSDDLPRYLVGSERLLMRDPDDRYSKDSMGL